jgi:glyoxylase-like metal-dependent hydrolase (beta-lactamase superfamily II)
MAAKKIADGLWAIPAGPVNTFLIEPVQNRSEGCTLIDAGFPGKAEKVLDAVKSLGKQPSDIRNIVLTHGHPDHIGSLAALQRATGAQTWMLPLDAGIAESGTGFRPLKAAPGLINAAMIKLLVRKVASVPPTAIDHRIEDGDTLPFADGMHVIHTPGHCAGQVALLWPRNGGVLFAADACMHLMRLDWTIGYEDILEGERSLKKLGKANFQIACFGHGGAILTDAARRFQEKWPDTSSGEGEGRT